VRAFYKGLCCKQCSETYISTVSELRYANPSPQSERLLVPAVSWPAPASSQFHGGRKSHEKNSHPPLGWARLRKMLPAHSFSAA